MLRRQFVSSILTCLSGTLVIPPSLQAMAQLSPRQQPWKIKILKENIGIFTEKGGTILFYIGNEGIAVVDSQFPEQAKHLMDAVKRQTPKPIQLLINTHHHGDHVSGNIAFKGVAEHLLAHANSKKNQERVAIEQKKEDELWLPNQTFTDSWSQSFGKETIALYHYGPAHTNGDSLVHFERGDIVHMGDLVFNRRHPFIDRTAGASIKNWLTVLETTIKKFSKKTTYVFGHAGDGYDVHGTRDDVKAFYDYLSNLLRFTEAEIKGGKTKEDFLKNISIPGVTEWKGEGIIRPLTAAYEELMGH